MELHKKIEPLEDKLSDLKETYAENLEGKEQRMTVAQSSPNPEFDSLMYFITLYIIFRTTKKTQFDKKPAGRLWSSTEEF